MLRIVVVTGFSGSGKITAINALEDEGFIQGFSNMINYLLPEYVVEGKRYLAVGIGCTEGRV
ncbi:MAG: hypothetical protein IMF07_09175 [Proteobacteria bacterium]|nr:hypothetical protein [Pseudomonadota bacterium]